MVWTVRRKKKKRRKRKRGEKKAVVELVSVTCRQTHQAQEPVGVDHGRRSLGQSHGGVAGYT